MNKILHNIFLLLLYISTPNSVNADVPHNQVKEVKHLLLFVKSSGCILTRNGTDHSAEKGVSHIEKKYDYYRDDISSTEEFIKLSATKSIMSGDYYTVTCSGKETIKMRDWLLMELKQFRDN